MLRSLVANFESLGAISVGVTSLGAILGTDLGAFFDAFSGVFLEGGLETA